MNENNKRELFWSQEHKPVAGVHPHEKVQVYQLAETEQILAETVIDSGLGGETVELVQISDLHINRISALDKDDEEVLLTLKHRYAFSQHEIIVSVDRMLRLAKYTDLLVLSGDIMDFLSEGNRETVQRMIFHKFPEALYVTGYHEFCKHVQTGQTDRLPFEERQAKVQSFWPNNIFYTTRDIKDKVIAVGLYNNLHYDEREIEPFKKDIERARREHKIILIFEHEPISTGRPEDKHAPTILQGWREEWNVYDGPVIGGPQQTNDTDRAMLDLITGNADVVKGIFHGHYHDIMYTEVPGFYTDASGRHEVKIPQIGASACCYFGGVGIGNRIIVK